MYYYNVAQTYELFLQVGRLYRALILLGLAFCLPSSFVLDLHGAIYIYIFFFWKKNCLHPFFTFYWTEPGEIGPWLGWLTIVLQCCNTVGYVIRPVKSSPKWCVAWAVKPYYTISHYLIFTFSNLFIIWHLVPCHVMLNQSDLARVHLVHLMNIEWRQAAADPRPSQTT